MKNIFLISIFFYTACFYSQIKIKGKVKDRSNNNVGFANIIVTSFSNPSKTISYTTSDENGNFTINEINEKEIVLEISAIGYKKKNIQIKTNISNIKIELDEERFELKEVTIQAKVYKDTVNLKTENMNLTQNSTLRDILNKNNGFDVSKNGAIIVDGKPITKILINKKEVFVNQNSIALDNVTYDMIKNVQLINNYKDKFNIDFDNRKTSVINIETKDNFKGVAKFNVEAGYGYKNRYLLKGKAMFFSDKFNSFLTQNINNIINRDFNFENLSESYKNTTSTIFKTTINPFIDENKSISKDYSNGTSLIIRKEFNKFKISSVIYYNHLNQTIDFLSNKQNETNTINDESTQNKIKSNFTSFNFSLNYFIEKNTVLLYDATAGLSNKKENTNIEQKNYFPIYNLFNENDNTNTKSTIYTNNLTIKKLINEKLIFTSNLSIFNENSKSNLSSILTNSINIKKSISQDFNLQNNRYYGDTNLDYSITKLLNIVSGLNYSYTKENLENKVLQNLNNYIIRNDKSIGLPIALRGDNDKISYIFKITPTLRNIYSKESITQRFIPITSSIYYKLTRKKSINLYFESKYHTNDIFKTIDTTYTNFNNRTISDKNYNLQLNQNKSIGVQYSYNSLSKSKYFSTSLGYIQINNALQNVFSNFSDNILFYKTIIIENQKSYTLNITTSKGYYISEKLHKITFSAKLNLAKSNSLTSFENELASIKNILYQPQLVLSFEPQKTFFKELNISLLTNHNLTFINKNLYNTEKNYNSYIEFIGEKNKFFFNIKYYYNILINQNQKFYRSDIDFNLKYKLNDSIFLTCQSNALLTLLSITNNNISNLSINANQGLTTTTINPSILGYLITGIQIKL
ncbi:carboxypeptidase-like regulatory domain-containing protein [Flavobacterium sp.]|uniref:carboxypeptidase-like regulatory domain-containing protein n=1 Tax=Flavobacterium sp. TaxID=239 RepID=UPI0037535075